MDFTLFILLPVATLIVGVVIGWAACSHVHSIAGRMAQGAVHAAIEAVRKE